MSDQHTVVVTGATGRQGGQVARALLERGHAVRALTRRPDSTAARQLAALGAEPVTGAFDDAPSIERAAKGADAMFLMSTPFEAGPQAEIRQGTVGADAADAAGIRHLVYSSVASADQQTGIPHFESKYRVEKHIRGLGIPYTIIAPAAFLENVLMPQSLESLRNGELTMPLPPSRPLQQTAIEDVGRFAALVIERPEAFHDARIDIASAELTGDALAETIARHSGRPIRYVEIPAAQLRAFSEDLALMFEWFDRVGYSVDIERLRRDYPEVGWHTGEDWVQQQNWSQILGLQKA